MQQRDRDRTWRPGLRPHHAHPARTHPARIPLSLPCPWLQLLGAPKGSAAAASRLRRGPRVSAGLFQSSSMADFHRMTSWELSECRLREGDGGGAGGGEEGSGLGSRAGARLPATQLHVRRLGRSAPPAVDKGWEDARAPGCGFRAAWRLPEPLRPPPVSARQDHAVRLAAGLLRPRLAVPGARVLDPERGSARPQPSGTGSRCLCPGGSAGERRLLAGVRGGCWDPTPRRRALRSGGCCGRLPGGSYLCGHASARAARKSFFWCIPVRGALFTPASR